MTETATEEKNIVQQELFVGLRCWDYRRWGILMQQYRSSGLWTIPVMARGDSKATPLELALEIADKLHVQGSRKVVAARTLAEFTSYRAVQGGDNDFLQWDMIVYDVEVVGKFIATLGPVLRDKFKETRFRPPKTARETIGDNGVNEITYRFLKLLEKQACLQ